MYEKPTTPRSIGEVFAQAIRIYKGTGRSTWILAFALEFVATVPWLLWQRERAPVLSSDLLSGDLLSGELVSGSTLDVLTALPSSPTVWLAILIAIPIYGILYSALIANVNGIATGQAVSAAGALRRGARLLPRTLLLGFLVIGIVIVGLLLLLVPGIYWAVSLQLSFIALVVEDAGVPQSMTRSRGLIKGHWGRAATLVSYVALINLAAYLAVSLITGVVALIFGAGGSATSAVSELLSLAADTLVAPLYPAVFVAMYYDFKSREAAERSMAKAV
jgi:uncharacterized protein UPF0259